MRPGTVSRSTWAIGREVGSQGVHDARLGIRRQQRACLRDELGIVARMFTQQALARCFVDGERRYEEILQLVQAVGVHGSRTGGATAAGRPRCGQLAVQPGTRERPIPAHGGR